MTAAEKHPNAKKSMSRALRVYTRVRELHVKGVSLITSATADHLLLRWQMAAETAKIGLTPLSCEYKNYSAIRNAISHPFRNALCKTPEGLRAVCGSRFQPPNIFRKLSKPAS